MSGAAISGLGEWFPDDVRHNHDWPEEFVVAANKRSADRALLEAERSESAALDSCQRAVLDHLTREADDPFLGSHERRVADHQVSSAEAEAWAAEQALSDANVPASAVDAVLSWALVPDRVMPSNACRVSHLLKTGRAWASSVDSACASPISQLEIASALIESGRARHVLLTQSHLSSRAMPLMHPSSPCMGDGATAMLVSASKEPGICRTHLVTHGEFYDTVMWCRGRSSEEDNPWWEAGEAFVMSSRNPAGTRQLIRDVVLMGVRTITELADKANFSPADIDLVASVQPRAWIPLEIARGLGLSADRAPQTFEHYAHLGGAGAIVNLLAARKSGELRPGKLVVLYAQGAGFTRGAVALRWQGHP